MITDHDLDLLRNLSFDSNSQPNFELLKYCLIWSDEVPTDHLSSDGREFLSDLWIVRGFLHRGLPKEKWGLDPEYFSEVWDFALNTVPQWPGFKRIVLSDVDSAYLATCLSTPLSTL